MNQARIGSFSDGVIAIIITIMVLEMRAPADAATLRDLLPVLPSFLSYVLSFLYLGIYWNNHHHLLATSCRVDAGLMWANLHLLFWLSLVPFATAWMGRNHFEPQPTAVYGVVLTMAAVAYWVLQSSILHRHGRGSPLADALGRDVKGKGSIVAYLVAVPLALRHPEVAWAVYAGVALLWLVPDRRLERAIEVMSSDDA